VLEEAHVAYKLNSGLLTLLQVPESQANPPQKPERSKALYEPSLVSFGGLISVVMTVGLAHLVFTSIGGARGSSSCVLRGVEPWLRGLLSAA